MGGQWGRGRGNCPGHGLVFRPGLSGGRLLTITGSHSTPLVCVSTRKVGSETVQGAGLEVCVEKRQQLSRGEAYLVT